MLTTEQKSRIGFTYIIDLLKPASPYGRQEIKSISPFVPGEEIALKLELENISKTLAVLNEFKTEILKLEQIFTQIKHISASIERVGAILTEVDLFELKRFLLQLAQLAPLFDKINNIAVYHGISINALPDALKILDPDGSGIANFHISSRSFPELAAVREEKKQIELKLRGNPSADELVTLNTLRTQLAAHEQVEERAAAHFMSSQLMPWKSRLLENTRAIARLDLTIQKAKLSMTQCTCMPEIIGGEICVETGGKSGEEVTENTDSSDNKESIVFEEMSNPQINHICEKNGRSFTPLSIELKRGATVITGANMGGKSVALKTIALNTALIHYGFFPFAKKAKCPLLHEIFLISDDLESTARGLSSFAGEVVMLKGCLEQIQSKKSLILLDEFARGTNPHEGSAIARSACKYLNKKNAFTVITTHFEGVAAQAKAHYQSAGLSKMYIDEIQDSANTDDDEAAVQRNLKLSINQRISLIAQNMDYGLHKVSANQKLPNEALNICRILGLDIL